MTTLTSQPHRVGRASNLALATILIAISSGCDMTTESSVHKTQKAYEQTSRSNLLAIYGAILKCDNINHAPPKSLTELSALRKDQLVCPFTNDTAANGDVSYIYTPEAFGSERIMVYSRSVVEQDYGFALIGNGKVRQIRKVDLPP